MNPGREQLGKDLDLGINEERLKALDRWRKHVAGTIPREAVRLEYELCNEAQIRAINSIYTRSGLVWLAQSYSVVPPHAQITFGGLTASWANQIRRAANRVLGDE